MLTQTRSLLFALLVSLLAPGQTAGPVTASAGAAGVALTNATGATVTALVLEWNAPGAAGSAVSKVSTIRFYDAATEPLSAKPIPPGSSVTVPISTPAQSAPQVVAVLFAGGETWGSPVFVARLTQRRVYMQQALTNALADLNAAVAAPGTTKASLASQFQSAQATEQAAAADNDQKACIHTVRGPALANLQGPATLSGVIAHEIGQAQSRLAALKAYGVGQ